MRRSFESVLVDRVPLRARNFIPKSLVCGRRSGNEIKNRADRKGSKLYSFPLLKA